MSKKTPIELAEEVATLLATEGEWQEKYYEENEENGFAEALSDSDSHIPSDAIATALDDLEIKPKQKKLILRNAEKFADFCRNLTPQSHSGYYNVSGSVASIMVGEIENQLTEETVGLMKELFAVCKTVDNEMRNEILGILRRGDHGLSDLADLEKEYTYINTDSRWCLVITNEDVDGFLEELKEESKAG